MEMIRFCAIIHPTWGRVMRRRVLSRSPTTDTLIANSKNALLILSELNKASEDELRADADAVAAAADDAAAWCSTKTPPHAPLSFSRASLAAHCNSHRPFLITQATAICSNCRGCHPSQWKQTGGDRSCQHTTPLHFAMRSVVPPIAFLL